jgi:N12 class adenine-specific DNA methylase/DNA repair protein RadC
MAKPFFTNPATNDYLERQQAEADRLTQQAEQNAAQADRANQEQQRLAERNQREQESLAIAQQKEAQKEALRAQNVQTETALQQQNRPQFTDAAGVIRPQQDDATFAAEQAAKTQAKADAAKYQQEGRKFTKNPIDGSIIPLQSDDALAAKKAADAEKTRRSLIDRQLAGLRTETQNPEFAKSRLSPEALTKAETALAKKKQEARDALIAKTSQQAEAQTGTNDWVPFNTAPAPEAEAAKAKLARLQDPANDLTDEDLAELEADPIYKSTTAAVRNLSTRVTKAKEANDYLAPRERSIWEQEMRRDNPDQYREIMRQKLATDPAALEQARTDFDSRRQQIETTAAGIQQKRQDTEAQIAALDQQNADALAAGVSAADLVHFEGPDGQPQPWSKALAAKRAEVVALHQAWESEQAPVLAELDTEQKDLNATAGLLNEAQTQRQQTAEVARKKTLDALATQPGGKALAAGITQLDQERAQRTAALPAAGPEREAAAAALEADLQAKNKALQDQAAAERVAANKFYRHLKEFSPETDWSKPQEGLDQVLRNAGAKAGIDPETAKQYLPSFAERDWQIGDKEATSRLTSDGQLLINPTLALDEKAYTQAVADAKATPEQKKAALAELPKAQADIAAASVGVLSVMDDNPVFAAATGSGAGFVVALENPMALARFLAGAVTGLAPSAVPSFNQFVEFIDSKQPGFAAKAPSEQAAAYLKAVGQTRGVLDKYKDQILSGLISGTAAIPQQIAGAYAALTGNADAAQFASDLTTVAGIDQQRLELTGSNDAPGARFAGSIASTIPSLGVAIGGGMLAQGLTRVGLAFTGVKTAAQAMTALETAGITGSSLAGGAQSMGGFYADAYNTFTSQGMPHAEAHKAAQMPAMLAGMGTALLTVAGGPTGVESLFAAKGGADAVEKLVRTRWMNITRGFLKEGASEGLEEGFDQLWQGFLDQAAIHPDKTVAEIFSEALEAGAIGGLLGGAIGGVQGAAVSTQAPPALPNPANLPETVAAAETAIDALDLPDLDPQTVARTQDAARSVLYIAQGSPLTDLPADSLAALDIVEDPKNPGQFINGKIVAGKDGATKLVTYAGGQVSDPATGALRPVRVRIENGQPIISQTTLDNLEKILPAVRAAVALDETARRAQVRTPNLQANPATSPNAAQASVQSPTGSGTQPTRSDQTNGAAPVQVGGQTSNVLPPEGSADTPVRSPEEDDRVNQLSLHLTELGLPPAQAEAVAQAMVAKRGVVGTDYTEQVVSKEFSADLKELGISGSLSSVKAKENPLKAGPDFIERLTNYSFRSISPLSTQSAPVQTRISEQPSKTLPPRATESVPPRPPRVGRDTTERDAWDEAYGDMRKGGRTHNDDGSPYQPTVFDETMPLILTSLAASGNTDEQRLDAVGDQSETSIASSVRTLLNAGWVWDADSGKMVNPNNPSEKPLDFLVSQSAPVQTPAAIPPVPTAPTSDSSTPVQGAVTPAQGGVNNPQGKAPATPAVASPAGIDADAYLTARQAAMKAIPTDQRQKALKLLGALDKAITRYGSAFAGVRFVPTPGGGLAVNRVGGKAYLDIDLGQWVRQHAGLVGKAGVVALTELEEEFIHVAAASIFTDADMRGFFRSLPADLQRMVYKGYHVADIANKALPSEPPAQFNDVQATQLGHEFLRMLVQDTTFNGRVSEAIAADPGLGQKIIDFLQQLVGQLRKLIDKADPDIRVTIAEYEKRVTNEVKRLKKLLPNPLTAKQTPQSLTTAPDNRASVSQSPSSPVSASPSLAPVLGSTYTAYTDSNEPIEVQWAVVDVKTTVISNRDDGTVNSNYPQELQPRDRTSAGSEAQVADIAKNFNLDRLSSSNGVGDGAPIIGPDGVVESGNGRMMGARRAYGYTREPSPAAKAYRDTLIKRAAEFGLNAEQVEAVSNPVLVRIRRTEVNRSAFVLAANVSTIAPKRDIEQAKIDAGQIVPDLFESFVPSEDGDIFTAANADFIRGFISAVIPPAERGAVIDARGNLSQAGLRRLRNALFVHAYGKSPEALNALARLTESVEATDTNIARAFIALAPRFGEQNVRIAAGALQPVSITEDLTAALQILSDLKNRGEKVADWLAQDRIPGIGEDPGPVGNALVQYLHDNRQRPRQIIETLSRYASAVDGAGDPRQMSMFGDDKPTKLELWNLASNPSTALAKSTVAASPSLPLSQSPALPPKTALKLYRTLTAKQKTAPLTPGQSQALEQAESSLGQLFMFDDPSTRVLKPAEDLVLEQETVSAPKPDEQLRLFASSKSPISFIAPLVNPENEAILSRYENADTDADSFRNPAIALRLVQGQVPGGTQPGGDGTSTTDGSQNGGRSNPTGLAALPEIDPVALAAGIQTIPQTDRFAGQEHQVYRDRASNRVVKLTSPGQFGARNSLGGYLLQMQVMNDVFSDGVAIEGWIKPTPDSGAVLVTSQPWISGKESTLPEIDTYMRRRGFLRMYDGAWWNPSSEMQVTDALPKNFITSDTGHVHPIDLIVSWPPIRAHERIENIVNSQPQPDPTPEPPATLASSAKAVSFQKDVTLAADGGWRKLQGEEAMGYKTVIRLGGETRRKFLPMVWDMMELSYAAIGNPVPSAEALMSEPTLFDVIIDPATGKPIAFVVAKINPSGYKAIAFGSYGTSDGKAAVRAVIGRLTQPGYWAELSDAPAHIANKINVPRVPSSEAAELLGKTITLLDDGFLYERMITGLPTPHIKSIFGVPWKSQQPKSARNLMTSEAAGMPQAAPSNATRSKTSSTASVSPGRPASTSTTNQVADTHTFPDGYRLTGQGLHTLAKSSVRAYHGTPHKIPATEGFRTDKIGTGEGAQAYGHGLYFAEDRRVGQNYVETLAGTRLRLPDGTYADEQASTPGALKILREARFTWPAVRSLEAFRQNLQNTQAQARVWALQGFSPESNRQYVADVEEVLRLTVDAQPEKTGNLYTVELLGDPDTYLDWDRPLSEQSEKVRAAFNSSKSTSLSDADMGYDAYADVSYVDGDGTPASASKWLSALGIPGIRYLDANSRFPDNTERFVEESDARAFAEAQRAAGMAEVQVSQGRDPAGPWYVESYAQPQNRNYVIFDQNLIRILEENGQPVDTETTLAKSSVAVEQFKAAVQQVETTATRLEAELTPDFRAAVDESIRTGQPPRYPVPAGMPPPIPSPSLDRANRIIEARFFQQIFADPGKAMAAYLRLAQADFGNPRYLNADLARSVLPDYAAHNWFRTAFDGGTIAPAGYLTLGLLYQRFLKQRKNVSLNNVVLLAGGPSSGKTTVAKKLLKPELETAVAIVDSVMGSPGGAAYLINSALQAGIRPRAVFVFCPFEKAALHALKRLVENGRPVHVKSTAKLHVSAQKTFLELAASRSTDVSFKMLVNDGVLNDIREEPLDFLRERAYHIADENAAENLARSYGELVEREFDYAGLTPSQYAASRWGRLALENLGEIESRDARRGSPDGQTDSPAEGLVGLAKSKVRPDAGPDLFSFNAGLGLTDLLTPAQKEAKVQQAQTLDLFGGLTNAQPRPTAQRPARPVTPPRRQLAPEPEPTGFGELFDQTGMAGGNAGGSPTGLGAGPGTGGNDTTGGDLAGDPQPDSTGQPQDGTGDRPTRKPRGARNDAASTRLERPALDSPARNFAPPADLASLAPAGNKAKIQANLAAIRLLKTLETEERNATPEEKRTLAAYTGWGAFKEAFNDGMADAVKDWKTRPYYSQQYKPQFVTTWEKNYGELHSILKAELSDDEYRAASRSTLNAHYTAAPVIRPMWKMVERLGFKGGRALEPSGGNGHYIGLQPAGEIADRTQWQAVELDDLSARMLAKLYPEATVNERRGGNESRSMDGMGFERARIPNGSLDLIISNVPFHESGPRKKGFPNLNLHNFFFAHALDKVKPGGLVAFITSASTLQNNLKQRDFIASKGDLVAAIRLPNNAFKENAGTEVVTDILIFRKPDGTPFKGQPWRNLVEVGRQTITLTQGKDQLADELRREAKANGNIIREYEKDGVKAIDVDAPILVNEYFADHPEHVLGQHSLQGSMYRGNEYTVTAPTGFDVGEALDRLVSTLPENVMGQQEALGTNAALADRSDRPFSFTERDGKIYEVQDDGTMLEPDWSTNPAPVKTFRSWQKVKDAARALIQSENSPGTNDTDLGPLRKALNLAYDTHVATHGAISKRFGNKHSHLYSDPEYPLTAALENEKVSIDTKTGKKTYSYGKAAIMKQRVVRPIAPPTKAANFAEALDISLAWRGAISPNFMAELLGIDAEDVMQMADEAPGVFLDPSSSNYETGEAYLVGNVRRKLEEAEAAAEDDPKFRKNVEALTLVQPEYRGIGSIDAALGERWIPSEVYNAFIKEVLGGSDTVEYVAAGNMFRISGTHLYRNPEFASKKMGSAELLDTLLSLQEPMIYYTDREGKRHFDATNTAAAKSAAVKMKRAFAEFVKTSETPLTLVPDTDPTPVWKTVEQSYNDALNNYVTPKQTGEYLQFPGLSEDVWRTPHRRAVIARFLAERRGMMAHGVGSGKTFNQIILAQEMRRLGLAKKPLIVVQNSTLGQFAASYLKAYPAARILVPTERDLQTQNRRKLVSKIATGDYDAVILSHSQFDLISNKPESVKAYMGEKIDELKALIIAEKGGDKSKVRDLEGMLKRLEDRLASMLNALGERQDSTIYFEDLGVDALIVDEAHNYKSVPIVTRMARVKGVPSGADSQRAIGMLLKARHVQSKTGGKNVFLATGTPVKNSMAEAYIMMEIMAPDVLQDYKIYNFDDFATSYGEITSSTEISWSGQPKVESRFAKFKKGRELITMIRTVFDVAMGNDTLGLKVPKVKGGAPSLDIVPVTPTIERFNAWVRSVSDRWKEASGKEKEEFTAVPIMTLQAGIAAALDPRLLAPNAPDHAESKVNTAIREMLRIYKAGGSKKTTQLVFADLRRPFNMDYLTRFAGHPFAEFDGAKGDFDLYTDIKAKLIAGGVKESEILLLDPSMSKAKRTAMFEKVSSGEIRIAVGSTETLGVGVNVQERIAALHHLMPPRDFTPAMHEQRNGRAIRQGNLHFEWNEEIEIRQWGTEGSMDSAVYATLGRKQRFITQLLMGEIGSDTFDDPTDPIAVNLAEMAARTMGDPDFIRRIEVEKELRDLKLESDAFTSEVASRKSRLNTIENNIQARPATIAMQQKMSPKLDVLWTRTAPRPEGVRETTDISDKPVYEFGDKVIDTAGKDGGITDPLDLWLLDQSGTMEKRGLKQSLPMPFKVNGVDFLVSVETTMPGTKTPGSIKLTDSERRPSYFQGAESLIRSLRELPRLIADDLAYNVSTLASEKTAAEKLRALIERDTTFPRAAELAALEQELIDVDARLAEKAAPSTKNQEPRTENPEPSTLAKSSVRPLDDSDIQGYLDLPNVNIPTSKQPAAKRAIRAATTVRGEAYPLPVAGGIPRGLRDRVDTLRDEARRAFGGLTRFDTDAIAEAFKKGKTISALLHDFVSQEIPAFDIRGAILESPADFAAFNLAVRTPHFESVKIAVLGDGSQVIHSQIVHVGSVNESILSISRLAGILEAARIANPKMQIEGFLIAHNHPSGETSPSDADQRMTRKMLEMAETLQVPFIDHVITNGEKYFSFREVGMVSQKPETVPNLRSRKAKLPVLPTPAAPQTGTMADWEAVPSSERPTLNQPAQLAVYLDALRTADPDHHHLLYLDTRHQLRAVERIPTSTPTAALRTLALLGAAREGSVAVALNIYQPSRPHNGSVTDENKRMVRMVRESLAAAGIELVDALVAFSPGDYFSHRENGLMESSPTLAKATVLADTPTSYDTAPPDPFTGIPSLITGPTLSRDQGLLIAQKHAQRLRAGLRGGEENRDAGPALAADRSRAFVVPILSAAQMDRLQALEPIGEGAEAKVYADRANGTVYKVLQGYAASPALGVWPDLFSTANGKLDYEFAPANRPRQLGVRIAVQSLLGGTPTEIVGIGPDGHVVLKQPLSSMPDIASRDEYIDAGVRTLAKRQAGLVLIPPGMLSDPKAPNTYLAVVEGRPYLVADLVPDNFVGDTQRNARLNDVVVTNLPASLIPKIKGLAQVVTQAGQEAARLGDRANRLFTSSKAVTPPENLDSDLVNQARESILQSDEKVDSRREAGMAVVVARSVLRTGPQAGFGQSQRQNREQLRREQQGTLAEASRDLTLRGKYVADEGEHLVHHEEPPVNLALKATNNQQFGYVLDQDEWKATRQLTARPALPSEYLWRLGFQNVLFGDTLRLTGIGKSIYGSPSIHTSQPWIDGVTPDMPKTIAYMKAEGFRQLPRPMIASGTPAVLTWYRPTDQILAYDTKPANFVTRANVTEPIDISLAFYPITLLEETAKLNGVDWQAWLAEGTPPPADSATLAKSAVSPIEKQVWHAGLMQDTYNPKKADMDALYGPGFYSAESKQRAEGYGKRTARPFTITAKKLFDHDAPIARTEALKIASFVEAEDSLTSLFEDEDTSGTPIIGEDVWNALKEATSPLMANEALAAAGYDGATYTGNRRTERDYIVWNADQIRAGHSTPLAKSTVNNSQPPQTTANPSPLAKLGWNHLDRMASAKLAALTRWTNDTTGAGEIVAKWGSHPNAKPFVALGHGLKRELFPDSVLPREIAARKREMEIKTALGAQKGMDLVRALSGKPKFSDMAYPPEFSQNPMHRRNLYLAMTGELPMSSLPQPLQDLGARLRDMLVDMGREAVKQGRMSTDTFANLQSGYMPHYYKEDVQKEKSILQRFRLGVRDILAQRTTAWHIVDHASKDKTGEPRLVSWQGNQWRFRNKEHRDAFYEDFILQETLGQIQGRSKKNRSLTLSDLRAPAKLDAELRGQIKELSLQLKMRYSKERPLDVAEQEKAGLIMDPVYAIARYTAQMVHDNSTAEFFNFVAANKDWTSDTATPGFTEIPDNPRFGRLAGKYVTEDVSRQILEMVEAPNVALQLYDTLLGWWKTGKTVLNPGTHMRNVLGNVFFSQLAGTSVWNPGNVTYYKQALRAMRNGGSDLMEAYEMGVLGADFVSVELRQTLRQLLPDPGTIADDGKPDVLLGIGKAIGRVVPDMLKNPLSKGYNQVAALYQAEDELFKLAAYLKAKAMTGSAEEARDHVRMWFPYFDSGTSGTLKTLGRTAMPFLGFYRESIRIFGNGIKERPLALATGLAVPSLVTFLSAMLLGLDDDDLDQVKKDMRGKAGKLLGPTPFEGMPLFSMLLPVRSDTGQVQQFDISAIHPFVDFLGNRVEATSGQDWYQQLWRSMLAAGPVGSLIYSQMTGRDTFGDRTFVEQNMTAMEKLGARADNVAKTLLPPLVPGGTGFRTLMTAGERSTNKTFETRSPAQAVARAVVGLDVRNATPDLYRIAEDWRKANGIATTEGMDFSGTTPVSRARKALFSVLAQDNPNREAIANIKKKLADFGSPIKTAVDVQRLLFYRNPLMIISGQENQQRFRASLQGLERQALEQAMAEYNRIKAQAPALLLR